MGRGINPGHGDIGDIARSILAGGGRVTEPAKQRPYRKPTVEERLDELFARTEHLIAVVKGIDNAYKQMAHDLNVGPLRQLHDTTVLLGALVMLLERKGVVIPQEIKDIVQAEAAAQIAVRQKEIIEEARKQAEEGQGGKPQGVGGEAVGVGTGAGDAPAGDPQPQDRSDVASEHADTGGAGIPGEGKAGSGSGPT